MDAFWARSDRIIASFRQFHDFEFSVQCHSVGILEQRTYSLQFTLIFVRAARTAAGSIVADFLFCDAECMDKLRYEVFADGCVADDGEFRFRSEQEVNASLKEAFIMLLYIEALFLLHNNRRVALQGWSEANAQQRQSVEFCRRWCSRFWIKLRLEVFLFLKEQDANFASVTFCESFVLFPKNDASNFQAKTFKTVTEFIHFVERELDAYCWWGEGVETVNWSALMCV